MCGNGSQVGDPYPRSGYEKMVARGAGGMATISPGVAEIMDRRAPYNGGRLSGPNRDYGCLNFGPFLPDLTGV